jgi:hypothetical protein
LDVGSVVSISGVRDITAADVSIIRHATGLEEDVSVCLRGDVAATGADEDVSISLRGDVG